MKKYNQADFRESTSLKKIWNKVIKWNDLTLATVLWHNNPWKIVETNAIFKDVSERSYEPIAEFHTQAQLWDYLKKL